jgi:ribonucleoside-diphosphate reductase alpha chain
MIPYSSLDAQHVNYKMYKHLHDESLKASQWLAELLGEPEWCKGYGVRNTHRTAQAPNKTTASLMGVSESNVPEPAMVYASASIAGEVDQLPVAFKDFLIAKGQYTPEVIQSIIANLGSVQHLDWMTPHEKAVFRNAFEEDQWIILRRAKQRQKWLCQGQSLNFFISEETREQSLTDLLSACVLEEDILSVYYGYFRSGVVVLDECINCQA